MVPTLEKLTQKQKTQDGIVFLFLVNGNLGGCLCIIYRGRAFVKLINLKRQDVKK